MRRLTRKLNLLMEEAICRELERLVPPGQRSQVVNEALRKELERIRRRQAVERPTETSSSIEKLSTREIVEGSAQDRSTH